VTVKYYLSSKAKELQIDGQDFLIAPRAGDAGYDLASAEDVVIYSGEQCMICTGVHVSIPEGYVGIIKDRSSMASRGAHVLAGVIDSSYRGEIKIIIVNLSEQYIRIDKYAKIAQMLIVPHISMDIEEVYGLGDLGHTSRGDGGFGSTGT
jgi:dUTP pyrophosphatase